MGRDHVTRTLQVLTVIVVIAGGLSFATTPASSSPVTAFEITDANILDGDGSGPDWGALFDADGSPEAVSGVDATSFVADGMNADALPSPPCAEGKKGDLTVFAGAGGEKNADPFTSWTYQSGSSPPSSNDLTNVYAASLKDGGDTIFYFGQERSNTSGDSHVDFEFTRETVGLEQDVKGGVLQTDSSGCPMGHFTGERSRGDLLISVEYSNGGAVGTAEVRVWDGDSYEQPVKPGSNPPTPWTFAEMVAANVLNIVANPDTIDCGPWNCRDEAGVSTDTLATHAFIEGYLNVSKILPVVGCFSGFNAKTRSSDSWTSSLKDFALGSFDTCDANISLTPDGVNAVGTNHTFTAKVETNDLGTFAAKPGVLVTGTTSHGSFVGGDSCTTGALGTCQLTITATTAGTSTVNVSATVPLASGASTFRSTATAPGPGGSGPATKRWVDSYIKVGPNDVNPINQSHVFTVEYGVLGAAGLQVATPTITPTVAPAPGTQSTTCASPQRVGTTHAWTCTVTINSPETGVFTATASGSAVVTMAGGTPSTATVSKSTSAAPTQNPGGNAGATKTYVDARISITPHGLNQVDVASTPTIEDAHTVTATVEQKIGNADWATVPAGTTVTFSLTGVGGFVQNANTCVTNASGQCSVQINSTVQGTTQVSASTNLTTATSPPVTVNRSSNTITKNWVDAAIEIQATATNAVNDPHRFTITVTPLKPSGVNVTGVAIAPTVAPAVSPPASTSSTTCTSNVAVDPNTGKATCTFTLNSRNPGVFAVDAATTVGYSWSDGTANHTVDVTRSTSAYPGPDGNDGAGKTFVDARVSLGSDGVNKVGDAHDVTGFAEYNDGTGWKPAAGETITFTETADSAASAFVNGVSTCTAGGDGRCTVQINSLTPGVTWVGASTKYTVGGVEMTRSSATTATDPANLRKEWVGANIVITPTAVNTVNEPHTFDILVSAESSGEMISIGDVTAAAVPTPATSNLNCAAPSGTSGAVTRACTLTINDGTAGIHTATASVTVTIGGVEFELSTNGEGGNSGPATKTYVDARIKLANDGVNEVGDPHPVTATVEVNDGEGWDPAPAGVTVTLTETGPGSIPATCTTTADSAGACTVDLTSTTAGVSTVHAAVTTTVLGEIITRETSTVVNTDAGGSADLTKRWVDGFVTITPDGVNEVGDAHTFTVTATAIPSGAGTPTFTLTPSVAPAPASLTSTCASPTVSGDTATCTVTINSPTTGVFAANVTATMAVGGVTLTRSTNASVAPAGPGGSGPASKVYVDAFITIAESAVNLVDDPHTFTITATAIPSGASPVVFGAITTTLAPVPGTVSSTCSRPTVNGNTATCTLTINSSVVGTFVANATANLTVGGTALVRSTDSTVATAGPGGSGPAIKRYEERPLEVLGDVTVRPAPPAVQPTLPRTGADVLRLLSVAVLLLASGAALVLTVRRRRGVTA